MTGTSASAFADSRSFRTTFRLLAVVLFAASACSRVESPSASGAVVLTTQTTPVTIPSTTTAPASTTTESTPPEEPEPADDDSVEAPAADASDDELVGELTLRVINTFPHDASSYTQGLAFDNGELVESSGLYGESFVQVYTPGDTSTARSVPLEETMFGAGIAVVDDSLIQLTWREGQALVHSAGTLESVGSFGYSGEGWGLCYDGARLAMSDGSDAITFRDPATFEVLDAIAVTREGLPVTSLNELECVNGSIWANVWLSNEIIRIDPETGEVLAWVDASEIMPDGLAPDEVLNGIAYSESDDTFYLTVKHWDELYQVAFE